MQSIVFSDTHMYKNYSRSYLMEDGMTSWLYNQFRVLDQIFEYAGNNSIELVIFNGDLFEQKNHLPQDLYNIVWDYFYSASRTFDIIFNLGNHDYHNMNSSSLHPFSKIVRVVMFPQYIADNMYMVPHGRLNEKIPEADLLFTHEDIHGLMYGNECRSRSTIDKSLFKRHKIVINGHLHLPQHVDNILNIGSCMKHEFGETGDRFFYHFDTLESFVPIKVECPDFIDIKGLSNRIKKEILKDDYNYYRIDISPEELSDDVFKKFNVVPNIVKQKKKKVNRLEKVETINDEIERYIKLSETNLNEDKLMKIGKELTDVNS